MKKILISILILCDMIIKAFASEKPNVIIIYNDDLGYQDLGCYGSPKNRTPRIDQLAKEGMRFSDFYSCSPVCSPSRASLLTGCYPQRVGISAVLFPNTSDGLNPSHATVAEVLKREGYATAAVGKWHLGDQAQYLPTNQGFDSYFGIPYSNDMYPSKNTKYAADCQFRYGFSQDSISKIFASMKPDEKQPTKVKHKVPLLRNLECIEFPTDQTTITKRYADEGIKFIQENVNEKKPFFLYLANTMPHVPLYVSPEFEGRSKYGLYSDVIEEIDYNVGRILDQLKALGIEENTIVIFSSDNGPWLEMGEYSGSALPLFEGKFTSFEGGMRVPCVIKWPAQIPAGKTSTVLTSTIDILPTLAGIVGAKYSYQEIDGKNILDIWKGNEQVQTPHEYFFFIHDGEAVRWGDWKYHKKNRYTTSHKIKMDEIPALYNLKDDIGESKNVIAEHPEIVQRLAKALDAHLRRIAK